jgi:putative ABC transport system ATP-binding protein
MSSKDTYHVLLCCESRQDADYFTNLLRARGAGHNVRTRGVGSLVELRECLADGTWELVLTTEGQRDLAAPQVIAVAREHAVPVVFCGVSIAAEQVEELLQSGASDVVRRGQGSRLFHAVSREIVAVRCRRALDNLRPRYDEAMRRCELLLEATDEPIAYAIDGVHLHGNRAYARVFGFEAIEDLEGVPQLDLVAPDDQEQFKEALRRYRHQPDEVITVALTALRNDGSRFPAQLVLSRTSYEGESCMQVLVRADAAPARAEEAVPSDVATIAGSRPLEPAGTPIAAPDRREVVRVEHAWKEYALGSQVVIALRDVSVSIADGEFMALAGPSGSGKSTLLNLIGCIDTPTRGSVIITGTEVSNRTPDELSDLRARTIGFIFQTFNLLPVLSAWENVEYPLLQNKDLKKAERRERVGHYLELVGLDRHKHHRPNELSGGQRQRVAIARALAARPSIVLADEPTANLDHKTGEGILDLMKSINQQERTTFIFSTHDAKVMAMADRVVVLSDGEVVGERHRIQDVD